MRKHEVPDGFIIIFRPYRIDPKTGRQIFPKRGKVFPMLIPIRK